MRILIKQKTLFNKIIEVVHGMTLAVHTNNKDEFENCVKELKVLINEYNRKR